MAADGAGGRHHVLQVGTAVLARGGAHSNKLDGAKAGGSFNIVGKVQAPGLHIARHHLVQTGFPDRQHALLEGGNLGLVGVKADNVIADF